MPKRIAAKQPGKLYRAKVALPGGCVKGTLVQDGKYLETGKPCPYNCAKEPKFFSEVIPPLYPPGTKLILTRPSMFGYNLFDHNKDDSSLSRKSPKIFKLPGYTTLISVGDYIEGKIRYIIVKMSEKPKAQHYVVPEKELMEGKQYYYVSSKGDIHSEWIGREPDVEKYRKSVGNYHATKENGMVYKQVLKEYGQPRF